jgi:hypothetical protein
MWSIRPDRAKPTLLFYGMQLAQRFIYLRNVTAKQVEAKRNAPSDCSLRLAVPHRHDQDKPMRGSHDRGADAWYNLCLAHPELLILATDC